MNEVPKKLAERLREDMKQIPKWKDSAHINGLIHRLERGDYDDVFVSDTEADHKLEKERDES